MKFSTPVALFFLLGSASAFCPVSNKAILTTALAGANELVPEPEGGEEIFAVKTLAGSRMKKMGESEGLTGVREEDEGSDGETPSKRARRASGGDSSVGCRADRGRDAIDLSGRVKLADAARALGVRKPNAPLLFRPILTAGLRPPRWLNACVGAAARSRLPAPLRS